jgi:hypothetical protein
MMNDYKSMTYVKLYTMTEYHKSKNFYEQIDMVFDRLLEKYGFERDLIQYKQDLLDIYDNENSYRSADILKSLEIKHFYIDDNGCIKSVK